MCMACVSAVDPLNAIVADSGFSLASRLHCRDGQVTNMSTQLNEDLGVKIYRCSIRVLSFLQTVISFVQ